MRVGFIAETRPVAKKEYVCQAAWQIFSRDCGMEDFSAKDLEAIKKAKGERYKILPGTKYIKVVGVWDGAFSTFKARIDLDDICRRYNLYEEY